MEGPWLTVRLAAAVSTSPIVNASGPVVAPTLIVWFAMPVIVGASLTALTVTTKLLVTVYCPSLTPTVIVAVPLWLVAGLTVTVRFAPLPPEHNAVGRTSVRVGRTLAQRQSPRGGFRIPHRKAQGRRAGVFVDRLIHYARECWWRVHCVDGQHKRVARGVRPSLTVIVIVELPVCPAAGVTVTVRLAPLPPNTMLATGTSAELEELALNVRLFTGVSVSFTVNGIAAVAVFTVVN